MSRLEKIQALRGEQKENAPHSGCHAQQWGIRAVLWLVLAFLPSALFLGLLLLPSAVHAAPGVFQKNQGLTGCCPTSITVPYLSNNTGGPTTVLVAFALVNLTPPVINISDTQSNTWTLTASVGNNPLWYSINPHAGANRVTVSSPSTNLLHLQIYV